MEHRPLLERDPDLAVLEAAVDAARRGSGEVVLVEGPAGIGKTRLVESFVSGLDERVLVARCSPLSRTVTCAVPRAWLRPLVREVGLGQPPFDGPAARLLDPSLTVGDVAWAVSWVVDDLAGDAPLVLVVDDVHWADAASLGILDHLATSLADRAIVLVLAHRSGEPTLDDAALERLRRRARTIRLQPLSLEASLDLVDDLEPEVAAVVAERGAGNPFFLRELAASVAAGAGPIPAGVVETVARIVERLPADAGAVARAVAVLGTDATRDVVREVVGLDDAELSDLLPALVEAQLVAIDRTGLRPAHPLVGDALLDGTSRADRTALHQRAAAALRRSGAADRDVAPHLLLAPPLEDPESRRILTDAGRAALAADVPSLAADHLARAVREQPEAPPELLGLLGQALAADGRLDEALAAWRRARDAEPDVERGALLLAEAGDALLAAGRMADAADLWRAELARLDPGSEAGKAIAVRIALGASIITGIPTEFTEALSRIAAQDPAADSHGDRLVLAAAAVGRVFGDQGPAAEVRALAHRSWADGRLLREETAAGSPLYLVTAVANWTDAFDLGLEILDAAMAEARSMSSEVLGTVAYCRGYIRMRQGALRASLDDIALAQSTRALGWDAYTPALLQNAIEAHLAVGDLAAAERAGADLRAYPDQEEVFYRAYRCGGLAQLALARGEVERGLAELERIQDLPSTRNPALIDWRATAVRLELLRGGHEAARDLSRSLLETTRAFGAPRMIASALVTAALADPTGTDGLEEAIALTQPAELALTRERAEARLLLAERTTGRASADHARAAYTRAAEEGMAPLRDRALALLRERGAETARESSPWDVLSPAERRVVEAVLTGLTNRQAAEHLFLTVKAIEWHLSSTYRKLGIRGRAELATLLRP